MSDRHRVHSLLIGIVCVLLCSCVASNAPAVKLPGRYWGEKQSQKILDKTMTIRLDPDLSHLSKAERQTVGILLELGDIMQHLYEASRHRQAATSYQALVSLNEEMGRPRATQNLIELYRLFKGPLARDLDGNLTPFLPVDPNVPGKNVYPWGVSKTQIDGFLTGHRDARQQILDVRTVVREATDDNLRKDRDALEMNPGVLGFLHPELSVSLADLSAMDTGGRAGQYYAVPYAVAYAEQLLKAYDLLIKAADIIEPTDADFSDYLRHRARDLLTNSYEAGDAAWVTGRFVNLNAQIGSYENYDDELFGVKSFFGLSVLVKDREMDTSLRRAVGWLQEFEDMLPCESHKAVRTDIPIGVYNIIADFGQTRGTNTATILPNESYITRKYGRTILLRRNILENPGIFSVRNDAYQAAVAGEFHDAYTPQGDFYRTMFHEIGHYLGPDSDRNGRTLDIALEEDSSILEELKSDLVSLYLSQPLLEKGYYDAGRRRTVLAAGVRRLLVKNPPKKSQAYATMELMQMNYYLEKGLLSYDANKNKLIIHFDKYHAAVESMLREVLALQYNGDKSAADRFIGRYTVWEERPHGRIADAMKGAEKYRYALVRYAALGE
jgi:hypothetical protein